MSNQFNYTYSAPTEEERKEIDSIRRKYTPQNKEETKLQRLRRLDALVKNTPTIWALCLGIVGCLVFGVGLTMILQWSIVLWGVIVSIVGAIPMAIAHPVYKKTLQKYKKRYGDEILKLSDEILNDSTNNQ